MPSYITHIDNAYQLNFSIITLNMNFTEKTADYPIYATIRQKIL